MSTFVAPTKPVITYTVTTNNVAVGTMTSVELQLLRRAVYRDPAYYIRSVASLFGSVTRLLSRIVWGTPVVFFWMVALAIMFDPQSGSEIAEAIASNPGQSFQALKTSFSMSVMISLLVVTMSAVMNPQYFDIFGDHLNRRICSYLKLPTVSPLVLVSQNPSSDQNPALCW